MKISNVIAEYRSPRWLITFKKFITELNFVQSFSYCFTGAPPTKRITAGGVVLPKRILWTSSSQTTPIKWFFRWQSFQVGCGILCLSFTICKNNKDTWNKHDICDIDNSITKTTTIQQGFFFISCACLQSDTHKKKFNLYKQKFIGSTSPLHHPTASCLNTNNC